MTAARVSSSSASITDGGARCGWPCQMRSPERSIRAALDAALNVDALDLARKAAAERPDEAGRAADRYHPHLDHRRPQLKKLLSLAAVLALAFVPCVDIGAQATSASDHFVNVTVVNGTIVVNPEILPVKGKNPTIFWVLQTADWTFPDDAIVFKTGTDDQFFDGQVQASGRKYHLKDRNTVLRSYDYTIKVQLGTRRLQRDPTIKNQGN
ncbi:MAG: hypothetical protein ABI886_10110 [Betaproteobacteria bacterium]